MKVTEIREHLINGIIKHSRDKLLKKDATMMANEFMEFAKFDSKTPIKESGLNYLSKKILLDKGMNLNTQEDEK